MGVITYNPDDNKYTVPAGVYTCRLTAVVEKEPFKGPSKFGKESDEPRLSWQFTVIAPAESAGKVIDQGTGTYPSPKSGLVRLLTMLLGRPLQKGEAIDPTHMIGRVYQIQWTINPKSEVGNCYIGALMAAGAPANGAAPHATNGAAPPAPTPPAPPAPPPPPAEGARRFWVVLGDGKTVEMDEQQIGAYLGQNHLPPAKVSVMNLDQSGGWKTALDFGISDSIPF